MRNREDGAVLELCSDGGLDEVIRLQVNRSRSFVEDQDLRLAQQSARQAHELTLPNAEKSENNDNNNNSKNSHQHNLNCSSK